MAARTLRHYISVAQATQDSPVLLATVPASRALVISKVTMMTSTGSGTGTFSFHVGGHPVAFYIPLTLGEVYTESGLIALAGETITVTRHTSLTAVIHVFGEEVDN